jgi:hypothetical protein
MRLRFTIRDLLWLTVLVAVCVAWWLDRRSTASLVTEARVKLLQANEFWLEAKAIKAKYSQNDPGVAPRPGPYDR